MYRIIQPVCAILAALFMIPACRNISQNKHPEMDLHMIQELQRTYLEGANTGDIEMFMSVWAEDAVRLESGIRSIEGKEKIRDHFKFAFEQSHLEVNVYGDKKIKISGDMAYCWANFLVSMTPRGSDTTIHTDFKFLEIYEKQDDGQWKIKIGTALTNPEWTEDSLSPDLLRQEDASVPKL